MAWLNYHHLYYADRRRKARSPAPPRSCTSPSPPSAPRSRRWRRTWVSRSSPDRVKLSWTDVDRWRTATRKKSFGAELQDVLAGQPTGRPVRFNVGIADQVPKLLARRLLAPVLSLPEPVHLPAGRTGRSGSSPSCPPTRWTWCSPTPRSPASPRCAPSITRSARPACRCSARPLAEKYRRGLPRLARRRAFLLPTEGQACGAPRGGFERARIRPAVLGEFSDSALLKVFGMGGVGLFAAPSAIAADIRRQYEVRVVGAGGVPGGLLRRHGGASPPPPPRW